MVGLQVLRSQFPPYEKSRVSVPIILKNQLYAIVNDRTLVDQDVVEYRDGLVDPSCPISLEGLPRTGPAEAGRHDQELHGPAQDE